MEKVDIRQSLLERFNNIILPDSVVNRPSCDQCKAPLNSHPIVHYNINQNPPEHKFCSKTCKRTWCEEACQ